MRFDDYQLWPANHAIVSAALGQPAGAGEALAASCALSGANRLWRPAGGRRHPKALSLPTDFAVVRLAYAGRAHAALSAALAKAPGVKSVSLDAVVRSPLALGPGSGSGGGGSRPGSSSIGSSGRNATVGALSGGWRRRLRSAFRRSWSFDEEGVSLAQATASNNRATAGRSQVRAGGEAGVRPAARRKLTEAAPTGEDEGPHEAAAGGMLQRRARSGRRRGR